MTKVYVLDTFIRKKGLQQIGWYIANCPGSDYVIPIQKAGGISNYQMKG